MDTLQSDLFADTGTKTTPKARIDSHQHPFTHQWWCTIVDIRSRKIVKQMLTTYPNEEQAQADALHWMRSNTSYKLAED